MKKGSRGSLPCYQIPAIAPEVAERRKGETEDRPSERAGPSPGQQQGGAQRVPQGPGSQCGLAKLPALFVKNRHS